MIFRAKPRKGRDYYSIVTSVRIADKVREKTVLYVGRLDKLTEPERLEIVKNLEKLAEPELIPKFHSGSLSLHQYRFSQLRKSMNMAESLHYISSVRR